MMGFHITYKEPAVTLLPIHLASSRVHRPYNRVNASPDSVSLLDRYFARPIGVFVHGGQVRNFDDLSYVEYYSLFRFESYKPRNDHRFNYFVESLQSRNAPAFHVILRDSAHTHLGRMRSARPSDGEIFYLRVTLQHRPARSFRDARTINGVEYTTFQEAAAQMGLFANENEAEYAMREAVHALCTPKQLRLLFVHLLVNECVRTPLEIWQTFKAHMALDFTLRHNRNEAVGTEHALQELSEFLEEHRQRLSDFGLPEPPTRSQEVEHELERWSSDVGRLERRARRAITRFNHEQRKIYDNIMSALADDQPLLCFIDGKAGRGKTFLVNAICDTVRALGEIALPTATSAFAAQLYPGGRTTHSALKVIQSCLAHPPSPSDMFHYILDPRHQQERNVASHDRLPSLPG
jgi:hypothetical protein